MNSPEKQDKLAVLIDADNASAAAVSGLFAEIAKLGIASVKRIYGDWSRPEPQGWKKDVLLRHALMPVQQFAYTTGKDATDMKLIIDAMDLLYSGTFDGVCLVSSDSDFTPLAARIRANGLTVYGFGRHNTPEAFRQSCDRFFYLENLQETTAAEEGDNYQINVHEKHDATCGGDPNTAPRLFTLTVAKADGKVSVDDPVSGETRVLE